MEARMSGRWPIVVAMLAAVACSSAAAPYREYEIRFDAPAPPSLDQSPSDSELIDAIAWLTRHRLDLPFPADIKTSVYVNPARLPGDVWAGVPGGRLARRAVWQREAHGIPRALRARRRSAGALGDGVPDPVSPVPRRVPRAAGWPGPAYAAGRSGQPAGIAAFFFSMIVRAYFSR